MIKLKRLFNAIYWHLYKLTPKGKRAYTLKQGLAGLQQSKAEGNITKMYVIGYANKLLKPKKILAFNKGKSIAKSKKTSHEVINASKEFNRDVLKHRGIKITKAGKFKNA
ncbi:hypothetical protein ES692_06180 [Psychroserpens burtonensis]|uniref:Uncharacterized protein n=1 Tax=Psychroserpens burtonensis TaxID=49278 RepID=A0A5C7BDG9_9FLAO|nr:hypothetical protein [Psychroserpens burtonensis]TXE18629.1 hypothetical protein ES692_06180 [Psychroserpens burtonensis]